MDLTTLAAVSLVDGRYGPTTVTLRPIFSEFGLIRHRVLVEVHWLQALGAQPEIGDTLIALSSLRRGIGKLDADPDRLAADLDANWEVLAKPIQTVMRRYGVDQPYERLNALIRGQRVSPDVQAKFVDGLPIPDVAEAQPRALTPERYIGNAAQQAKAL